MKKIFLCLVLLLMLNILYVQNIIASSVEKKNIKIDEKTMLDVSAESMDGEFGELSILINKNAISILNTFDKKLIVKQINKGFTLCNDKGKKRLEYIYDVKTSLKTITLYGEVKDEFEDKYNEYEVTINIVSSGVDKLYTHSKRWGVKENEKPKELIENIIVEYNKRIVNIPFTTYIDLADPSCLKIEVIKKGIELAIESEQEKDTSYHAIFYFKEGSFIRREVESGKFPNNDKKELSLYSFYEY